MRLPAINDDAQRHFAGLGRAAFLIDAPRVIVGRGLRVILPADVMLLPAFSGDGVGLAVDGGGCEAEAICSGSESLQPFPQPWNRQRPALAFGGERNRFGR